MRRNALTVLVLALLALLAACTDGGEQQRLQLAELERQNRADSLMTNDSLARDLADWFDRHGTANERLRAHYILGRTYADRGEAPQALEAYNNAGNSADTTAGDCDYHTLCRVHAQMAQLYYSQLLPDNMIREERLAMKYAQQAKDTMSYIACYVMLGEGYEMKNLPDSAIKTLLIAYHLYKNVGADRLAASLCCSLADVYRQKKDYQKAKEYILQYERHSGFFDENGNIEAGKEMYYSCKGHLCLETLDKDETEYYFRKLYDVANNYSQEIAAVVNLKQFFTFYFNRDSLIKYNYLFDSLANKTHIEFEMAKTLQVQAMYDYTRNERLAHQKEQESMKFKTGLLAVSALLVILIFLLAIFYIHYQDNKQHLEDRINLLRGYAVNERLRDSNTSQHFRELLKANPISNPSLENWKELTELIDREIPNFRKSICKEDSQLSDFEYDICMLIKIQIPLADIARLKHCSPSYITQVRKNVYRKLFMKKGNANDLDEYLMKLS